MSLEATLFTHSGITSNFIKIAEFMHSRYTDYLISGLKGDSKISDIVDGWKQAEQIFENVESADNIVSEISKLLGGEETISNKETSGNPDLFDKNGLLENDSIDNTNLLDEILNVKKERLSFASDDDERKTTKSTDETIDLLYNYDSKKLKLSTNTENKRVTPLISDPGSSINNLPVFSTFPTPSTSSNHQNYQYQTPLNHQDPLNPQNPNDTSLQDFDNFTKINSILNRPSLLYVNSENYSQRLHEPHTKSKQHLLPDKLVDQFGIPTGQIRGKYKGQVEVPSTSLIYDHQEFTMNGDNKLQCDWEGCNFSTPRRTALKRHIQCIHMDVRNYDGDSDGDAENNNEHDESDGKKEIAGASFLYEIENNNPEVIEAKKQLNQVKLAAENAKIAAEKQFQTTISNVISSIQPLGTKSATFEDYGNFNIYQMRDHKFIEAHQQFIGENFDKNDKKINNKKWRCAFCQHIFPTNFTAYHVKRHQNNNRSGHIEELKRVLFNIDLNALYKCEWNGCTKKFNRKDSLKKHMSTCKLRKLEKMKFDEKAEHIDDEQKPKEKHGNSIVLPCFDRQME